MNLFSSILLGVLQGLTEFLPVSSSGHLVIAQSLIPGFNQPGVLFNVVLHGGTVLAVLYYFREQLLKINSKYLLLLLIGTIPAGIIGLFLGSFIEGLFDNVRLVGFALIITGILNFLTDKVKVKGKKMSIKDSLLIGVAQALAIIPGISRSGATIFAGTSMGVKRKEAAKFSFLLSIPAIVGANVLQFINHTAVVIDGAGFYLAGFLAAFFSGVLTINLVLKFLLSRKFRVFSLYCLIVGILVLIL